MRPSGARIAIGIALAGLAALGLGACAPTRQVLAPAPPEVRAHIHRVGILGPPPPRFFYEKPTPGPGWGYLRGMGACFDGALSVGGRDAAALMLAGAIVGCPTIGGLVGAAKNPSDAEIEDVRAALERSAGDGNLGEALRGDLAARLTRDAPQYTVALLASDEPGRGPRGTPVDALVALDNLRVTLMRCDGGAHITPPLTMYAAVDAQLLRADTRAVLYQARIEYWGETFPFAVWGAAGAERFSLGLTRARNSLAERIVQSFFVAQTPTELTWPRCGNQIAGPREPAPR